MPCQDSHIGRRRIPSRAYRPCLSQTCRDRDRAYRLSLSRGSLGRASAPKTPKARGPDPPAGDGTVGDSPTEICVREIMTPEAARTESQTRGEGHAGIR